MSAQRGNRKYAHAVFMSILLTAGFCFAVWAKAPHELFIAYVGGLGTLSGAFIYGNVKEHQTTKVTP
jgi:hypothetical protein